MANQYSNRPPFCDFLERYLKANRGRWTKSNYITQRVGTGRFDEWLKISGRRLEELNWHNLQEFYRFISSQGVSPGGCARGMHNAKHAIRWGIEAGELPQKLEDIYTFQHSKNSWSPDLPDLSTEYLSSFEPTRPGSFIHHRFAHRVFHTYLKEKSLTYRNLRKQHLLDFVKYLAEKGFVQRTRAMMSQKVRSYLLWLYQKRKIKLHPDDLLPAGHIPKIPKDLPRPLDPELDLRLQELLVSTPDLYYKSILLLRRTGMRITELRKLPFNCVEYDIKKRASLRVPPVKLGIERKVPIDPDTLKIIDEIKAMSIKNHKKRGEPKHLVIRESGGPPRYERYSYAMAEICARLQTRKWINLHALRHTYATSLLNAGVSITTLKELLGHKSIHMTLRYAKVAQENIHAEYSEALKKMSGQQIPRHLMKTKDVSELIVELSRVIARGIDENDSPEKKKRIKAIQVRLSKIKAELAELA